MADFRYQYTVVFSLYGIVVKDGENHILFSSPSLTATLVHDPSDVLSHADRSDALAELMLRGFFGATRPKGELVDQMSSLVRRNTETRRKQFPASAFLVTSAEGDTEIRDVKAEREWDDFIVWIDGGDRGAVLARHNSSVNAALASLILYDEKVSGIRKVAESVIYFRDDGKPIYARTVAMGQPNAYVSSPLSEGATDAVRDLYDKLGLKAELIRVIHHLRRSFENEENRFQAFLSAWLALEVLINKTFPTYEARVLDASEGSAESRAQKRFLNRIKEVMKDKYGITDKFAAVAYHLDPNGADNDLATLEGIKKLRDGISHGDDFIERDLPLEELRALSRKYIRLQLG